MMLTNSLAQALRELARRFAPGKPHERKAPEVADEVLELLKNGKIRSLKQIGGAVGIENLEKLEELLDLVEGMKLIEKGYKLTDFGKRVAEWNSSN